MTFRNAAAEFVFTRTYARWKDELGRRETWQECVQRVMDFYREAAGDKVSKNVYSEIEEQMLTFGVMPSMRLAWAAGEAARRENVCAYNCSFVPIVDIQAFAEILYILMCGTGVGFSVEEMFISKLPVVKNMSSQGLGIHVVGDSKEGWAEALVTGLNAWFSGKDIEFDFTKVRPRGARLKVMGGRSSGPEPLQKLLEFSRSKILNAQGRKLTDIEIHDIVCMIAEIVVVGGVRRSSLISFSDIHSEEMRHAKDWPMPPYRFMANNSAVYSKKPDAVTFLKEWTALAASGSGERGIYNVSNLKKYAKRRDFFYDQDKKDGTTALRSNPCVPAGTEILTEEGYVAIDQVLDQKISVWNGFEFSTVVPKITGTNQKLVKVNLSSGQSLVCTEAHKFVISTDYSGNTKRIEASKLTPGMKLIKSNYPVIEHGEQVDHAYAQGFFSGDGMEGYDFMYVYGDKQKCLNRLGHTGSQELDDYNRVRCKLGFAPQAKNFVPFKWNLRSRMEWLAGLLDSDGAVLKEGGAQISSVDKNFLLQVQKMLTTMGVASKVTLMKVAEVKSMPDGHGGHKDYQCQDCFRLLIGSAAMQYLIKQQLKTERLKFEGFNPNRDASQFVKVESVEDAGSADTVFCFTENKRNLGCFEGVITGNCGEILLRPFQFCNLSEVVVRYEDTFDDLIQKVKVAVWMGAIQSTLTKFNFIRDEFRKNCEEERLLGVSLTGQMDNPKLMTDEKLDILKSFAVKTARVASKALGINMSTSITTGKPSGTVSQLVDAASGCHPRHSEYYIRRYRISGTDPLFFMMRDQGFKFSPENGQAKKDWDKASRAWAKIQAHNDGSAPLSHEDLQKANSELNSCSMFRVGQEWSEDKVQTWVVAFPTKSPKGAITRHEVTAIDQLNWYLKIQNNWCEHNQSTTVYVRDDEWVQVGQFVYENFDKIIGVSFLPHDGGKYEQAPYEDITKDQYEKMMKDFPEVDYSKLGDYERDDNTTGAQNLACVSGVCELP
jgi:ribonucleotide reductase alpha subunit